MVIENDAQAVALLRLNRGTGTAPVVAPYFHGFEWNDLPLDGLRDQVELLNIAIRVKRKIGNVWSLDGNRAHFAMRGFLFRFCLSARRVASYFRIPCPQRLGRSHDSRSR